MLIIDTVEITDMWGTRDISAKMDPKSNIFIGPNGTGKTTFINLIKAILTVDIVKLSEIDFSSIKIRLSGEQKKQKTIKIRKELPEAAINYYDVIKYRIGNGPDVPLVLFSSEEIARSRMSRVRRQMDIVGDLQNEINAFLNISMLSVSRELTNLDNDEFSYSKTKSKRINPVDETLEHLVEKLIKYQLSLESDANKLAVRFQKRVLLDILYSPELDTVDRSLFDDIDYDDLSKKVKHAFDLLGMKSGSRINKHIEAIKDSVGKFKNFQQSSNQSLKIDDALPLSLYKRTKAIVKISSETDENKIAIFSLVKRYEDVINDFFQDKTISLSPDNKDGFNIVLKNGNKDLDRSDLSSGEKQLLIIFTEVLLHNEGRVVFLADEPELSLHVSWQRKLLGAIKKINPNAQLIIATHSPEIAGSFPDSLIQMESVFNG